LERSTGEPFHHGRRRPFCKDEAIKVTIN